MQTELTCCGVNSPTDWHQSKSKQRPFLPESCCKAVEVSSMCRIDNETFGPYEKVIYYGILSTDPLSRSVRQHFH